MWTKESRKTECTKCKLYHLDFELEEGHIAGLSFLPDQISKSICDLGFAYEVQRDNKVCDCFTPKDEVKNG